MAYSAVLSSVVLVSNILTVMGGAYLSVPCPFTNPCEPYTPSPSPCQQYQSPQSYLPDAKWSSQGQSYASPFTVTIKYDSQNDYPNYPSYPNPSPNSRRSEPMSLEYPGTSPMSPPPYEPSPFEPPSNNPSAPKRGLLSSLFSLPGAVADSMLSGEISL